jgi:hypothetical protein
MTNAHINILARLGTALSGDVELSRAETEAVWDAVEALVEEVERLRDAECLADARVAEMHDVSMLRERAAVVAHLRTLDDRWGLGASVCGAAADDIERGEHRRTEEEP